MERLKYLFKNTFLSTFSTKLISFLMVSFYTSVLNAELYGQIDIIFTTINLLVPVVALSIHNSIVRFAMDEDKNRSNILLVGLSITAIGSLFVLVGSIILNFFYDYSFLCGVLLVEQIFFLLFTEYVRGIGKNGLYVICHISLIAITSALNILFLGVLNLKVIGYLYAYLLSYVICCTLLIICINPVKVLKYTTQSKKKSDLHEMVKYSIYLIPNSVFWWITNSSDKYMILYLIGSMYNGIYSVSNKIPTIITNVFYIFNQAWQLSAIKENGSKDEEKFVNEIFNALFITMSVVVSGILLIIKPFMSIYVSEQYYVAWQSSSILTFTGMFNILASFVGTQYVVAKENKMNMYTTLLGTVVNIVLNAILIPFFQLNGAAIATCISYIVVFIVRIFDTRKYLIIHIKPLHFFLSFALVIQIIFLFVKGITGMIGNGMILILITILVSITSRGKLKKLFRRIF